MTDNSSTQRAIQMCRVFTQRYPHGCVWRCNFLEMNNSGEQSGATVASRELYRKFMEERLSHGVNPHN